MDERLAKDLSEFYGSWEVMTDDYSVWNNPVYSVDFWCCQGIALIGQERIGLAHVLPKSSAKPKLEGMLERFGSEKILGAVILESPWNFRGYRMIQEDCNDYGIDILKTYHQEERFSPELGREIMDARDMLVIPSLKEVRIYSENGSYDEYKYNEKS